MLKNYFKVAFRNIKKQRSFSFINIFGLAVGIAAFWLITLYVTDEWSYDRYNTKAARIFRVVQHGQWNGGKFDLAITSAPYAPTLKADFAQVEEAIRINAEGGGNITYSDKKINEGNMLFTDAAFFNVFTHQFLYGDGNTALQKPQSIVLTKSLAETIFGRAETALNQLIQIDGNATTVTGVIADAPLNSHFTFKALRSMPAGDNGATGNWGNSGLYTYVLLKNPGDNKQIEAMGGDFFNRHIKAYLGPMNFKLELQPLTDIHLHSNLGYEFGANGNITYVYVFSITALLILVIAIINYVNLTTARSSIRIKEVAVRKVIGSGRQQLMLLFFVECIVLTFIATITALALIYFALPYFNHLSGKTLVLLQFGAVKTITLFAVFALFTGILCGIYPALFLSGFKTIPAMKGQLGNQISTIIFRKSLVTFQFVITIIMISGSVIIYKQLNYFSNKDLGFNKAQTLTFHINNRNVRGQTDALKQQLLQNPNIESVGVAGNPIGNNNIGGGDFNLGADGKTTSGSKIVQNLIIDADFIPTLQIKMAAGRNFSAGNSTDITNAIIVNETLVKELGWTNAVGKQVRTGVDEKGNVITQTIIGVVKDFNTYSLQHKISPMVLNMPTTAGDKDNLYVRIRSGNTQASLNYITQVFDKFDNENKPEFHFLDQNFAAQYQTEQKQGTILLTFTVLAVSIACLGLFGLVTFSTEQRVKEIGIRKTLGASVASIVQLLSTDLMRLVAIAALIACPIAWLVMDKWLQDFAYKININIWVFVFAGGIAAIVALATISIQSVKAALANPVKSLKGE
ncbi:ABC transporter permease [Mucilaginibacter calamicampi]|uniref:ABC transporter permease n=1 Tax=Mucilaginibacter calamicampi TaxID=1302352 RepID=A0ABW2YY52_9SPHI